ncbi:uncharacterized protein LOC111866967 isoform X2 [Cryptotermes secundus]|nr:uncharacterized protein LOC111866967 isoform X2 [Cryptotermes secundus]XP_033608402.1 uncharacterized protein LOC111866967 isoform X2 [Cryptotermes secundus]
MDLLEMSNDVEPLGILFDLQWKKKPGGNSREDVASIGIWDTPDASLDWVTFKSYVCQNMGTLEDIYVAYVDSDGDELPIESECEFQEALKFARQRAVKGKQVVLKVEKRGEPQGATQSTVSAQTEIHASKLMTYSERDLKKKHGKPSSKSVSKARSGDKVRSGMTHLSTEERKAKGEESSLSNEISKKLACIMKLETDKRKRTKIEKDDSPPPWFKKYMQKFKNEIVAEITTNVMYNTRQVLESTKASTHPSCCCIERKSGLVAATKSKKKKSSDEDSSDGGLSNDQRDHKLLKKIEKLHKREKKLEKKLDSKLEKLENKTKRRMEKKSQSKSRPERPSEKICGGTRKKMSDGPVGTYLMDAILLNDGHRPTETHIRLGERFTKVWEIMNNGTLPWTDKTELRLAWGSSGLQPKATVLKCPILMPGEKGIIAVTFQAPEFPGTFESYWHFYHMGVRFGHWLGCAVIVDSKEREKEVTNVRPADRHESVHDSENNNDKEMSKTKADQPVDLRKKYEPNQVVGSSATQSVAGTDDAYETMSEDKAASTEKGKDETKERSAEYESDSDDENLSIISGTISITSDSEEDENFVLVPVPPCFICDVPLEESGIITDLGKEQLKSENDKPDVQTDSEPNSFHMLNSSAVNVPCTLNIDFGTTTTEDGQKSDREVEDGTTPDISKETCSHEVPVSPVYLSEYIMSSRNEIYAVDMAGHCLPVDFAWASHNNNHCNHTLFENSKTNDHSSESSSTNESYHSSNQGKREENKCDQPGGDNSSFHATTHPQATTGPFSMSFSVSDVRGGGRPYGTTYAYATASTNQTQNIFKQCQSQTPFTNTTQATSPNQTQFGSSFNYNMSSSANETHTGFEQRKNQAPFSDTTRASSTDQPQVGTTFNHGTTSSTDTAQNDFKQCESPTSSSDTTQTSSSNRHGDPIGAAVHILPETLVNGAISVASQAYTTARAVLSNLRSRPSEEFSEWYWNETAGSWSAQPDRSTTECLNILLEMGFVNKNLNVLLLQRYDNDIAKVVAELLAYKDNSGFSGNRQMQ